MKYLMLDTNIYFDCIVHRSKDNPPESFRYLDDIVSWGNTQLIVPEIIVTETNRKIEEMVETIGKNLKNISNQLRESYWFSFDSQGHAEFNTEISRITSDFGKFMSKFEKQKTMYIHVAKMKINSIFRNALIIKGDPDLITNVTKRKIYRLCPFHKEVDSFGDALILESLLNIRNYEQINPEDKIYFISRNYKDFSDPNNKDKLHEDIIQALKENDLEDHVIYSRYFYKTLKEEFNLEYIEATQIQEEYNQQLIEQYEFIDFNDQYYDR
ncbi:hypothetical protein DET54_12517 [Paenibacillus pabuli]|uniref:DUF4935 domain-containing protein n=1 Tax=Paenibacillus pabuli TaxID=1472 RepID=A0ABX9BBH1_9BACL|nr:PIN domain-containing protein [Paenibacillus pabuli]RAI84439.1 hypothetical protein DET54_12517 [Paenibacillus pabuli]